jgi:anti-sigma factor RsiW
MKSDTCMEMQLLVQADADGELSPAEAARVAEHLEHCEACAALPAQLANLSGQIRQGITYHSAPEALRARLASMTAASVPPAPRRTARPFWSSLLPDWRFRLAAPFGAGFAVAALLLVVLLPRGGQLPDEIVAGHIRALQPGHLMDVVSTDQHTVKPWFDGRIDFAPPVRDLKEAGFPLEGGRLDYLAGRPVAVLIYQRRQHIIDVYVWPESGTVAPTATTRSGYNMVRWTANGMAFSAVSDLDPKELAEFARLLRA